MSRPGAPGYGISPARLLQDATGKACHKFCFRAYICGILLYERPAPIQLPNSPNHETTPKRGLIHFATTARSFTHSEHRQTLQSRKARITGPVSHWEDWQESNVNAAGRDGWEKDQYRFLQWIL